MILNNTINKLLTILLTLLLIVTNFSYKITAEGEETDVGGGSSTGEVKQESDGDSLSDTASKETSTPTNETSDEPTAYSDEGIAIQADETITNTNSLLSDLNNDEEKTITLSQDITYTGDASYNNTYTVNGTKTLDLNGKTITYNKPSNDTTSNVSTFLTLKENANLTIKDSTGNGKITSVVSVIYMGANSILTLEGGTLSSSDNVNDADVIHIGVNNSTVNINGGTITAKGSNNEAIVILGSSENKLTNNTINISGGTLSSDNSSVIYCSNADDTNKVNITGGILYAGTSSSANQTLFTSANTNASSVVFKITGGKYKDINYNSISKLDYGRTVLNNDDDKGTYKYKILEGVSTPIYITGDNVADVGNFADSSIKKDDNANTSSIYKLTNSYVTNKTTYKYYDSSSTNSIREYKYISLKDTSTTNEVNVSASGNMLYFLATSGGDTSTNYAGMNVTITYSDNTTKTVPVKVWDWGKSTFEGDTPYGYSISRIDDALTNNNNNNTYAIYELGIPVDNNKTISKISFNLTSKGSGTNYEAGIFAISLINGKYEDSIKEAKAKIGDTYYDSLSAAINALQANQTITLLADSDEDITISKASVTIDTNGYTLNKLTVNETGATIRGNGTISNVTVNSNKGLNVEGNVTVSNLTNNGVTKINGGTVTTVTNNTGTLNAVSGHIGSITTNTGTIKRDEYTDCTFGFDPTDYLSTSDKTWYHGVQDNDNNWKIEKRTEVDISNYSDFLTAAKDKGINRINLTKGFNTYSSSSKGNVLFLGTKTLNLNGNSICLNNGSSGGGKTYYKFVVGDTTSSENTGASLTIVGDGQLYGYNSTIIDVTKGSKLILGTQEESFDGVIKITQSQYAISTSVIKVYGEMIMNSGMVYTNNNHGSLANIEVSGDSSNNGKLTINGGIVRAAYNGNYCIKTAYSSKIVINGGDFESRPGAEVYVTSANTSAGTPTIEVYGGSFKHGFTNEATTTYATNNQYTNRKSWLKGDKVVSYNGSSYEVVDKYDVLLTTSNGGEGEKVDTLANAIAKATSGSTIKLLRNNANTDSVDKFITTDITIDLNGYTSTLNNPIAVNSGGTLTIKDDSGSGNLYTTNTMLLRVNEGGTLNIESGTYTATGEKGYVVFARKGTVNIKGGTIKAQSGKSYTNQATQAVYGEEGAIINMSGGTISATLYDNGLYILGSGTKATITGGEIATYDGSAITVMTGAELVVNKLKASNRYYNPTIYINLNSKATFKLAENGSRDDIDIRSTDGGMGQTIKVMGNSTLDIYEGKFNHLGGATKDTNLIYTNNSTVNVYGGYLYLGGGTGVTATITAEGSSNKVNVYGGELYSGYYAARTIYANAGTVRIYDGFFGSAANSSDTLSDFTFTSNANVKIYGGVFRHNNNYNQYLLDGYYISSYNDTSGRYFMYTVNGDKNVEVKDSTGEPKYYPSIAALLELDPDVKEIKLTGDLELTSTVGLSKDLTIDLNGHTISYNGITNGSNAAIKVGDGAHLTIKDTSKDGTGKIETTDFRAISVGNSSNPTSGAKLTIEGGTITSSWTTNTLLDTIQVLGGNAEINIKGGTIEAHGNSVETILIENNANNSKINITGGNLKNESIYVISGGTDTNEINISGGTLETKNSYIINNVSSKVNISGGNFNGIALTKTKAQNANTSITGGNYTSKTNVEGSLVTSEKKIIETTYNGDYKYSVVDSTSSEGTAWKNQYEQLSNKENITADDLETLNKALTEYSNLNDDDKTSLTSIKTALENRKAAAEYLNTYKDLIDKDKDVTFDKTNTTVSPSSDDIEAAINAFKALGKTKDESGNETSTDQEEAIKKLVSSDYKKTTEGETTTESCDVLTTLENKKALASFLETNKDTLKDYTGNNSSEDCSGSSGNEDGEGTSTEKSIACKYKDLKENNSGVSDYLDPETSDSLQASDNQNNFRNTYNTILSKDTVTNEDLTLKDTSDTSKEIGINAALKAYENLGNTSKAALSNEKTKLDNMKSAATWYDDNKDIINKGIASEVSNKVISESDKTAIDKAYDELSKLTTGTGEGNKGSKDYIGSDVQNAINNLKKASDFLASDNYKNSVADITDISSDALTSKLTAVENAISAYKALDGEAASNHSVTSYIDSNVSGSGDDLTSDTLSKLNNVKSAIEFIKNDSWYSLFTKSPLEESDLENLNSAYSAYNELTDEVKSLLPSSVKTLLDNEVANVSKWLDDNKDILDSSKTSVTDEDLEAIEKALELSVERNGSSISISETGKQLIDNSITKLENMEDAASFYKDNKEAIEIDGYISIEDASKIIEAKKDLDNLGSLVTQYLTNEVKSGLTNKVKVAEYINTYKDVLVDDGNGISVKSPISASDKELLEKAKSALDSLSGDSLSKYIDKDSLTNELNNAIKASEFLGNDTWKDSINKKASELTDSDLENLKKAQETLDSKSEDDTSIYPEEVKSYIDGDLINTVYNASNLKATADFEKSKEMTLEEINEKITEVKDAINKNENLTDEDKKALIDELETGEISDYIKSIENTNVDLSEKVTTNEDGTTTSTPKSAEEVKEAIEEANKNIEELKKILLGESDESSSTSGKIDDVSSKATDKATENLNEAKKTLSGYKDDNGNYIEGELDKKAKEEKDKIDASTTLTEEEKKAAKDKIDEDLNKAKADINSSTTLSDIDNKASKANETIENTSINALLKENKESEVKNLEDLVNEKIKEINNLKGLSDEEKNTAKSDLETIKTKYTNNINNAEDADSLKRAVSEANSSINSLVNKYTETSNEAFNSLIEDLDKETEEKKAYIDSLSGLTDEEKSKAKQEIETSAESAKNSINNAGSLDDAKSTYDSAKESIKETENTYKVTNEFGEAKNSVEEAAKKATKEVNALRNIDESKKQELLKEIENNKNDALSNINNTSKDSDFDTISNSLKDQTSNLSNSVDKTKAVAELNDILTGKKYIAENLEGLKNADSSDTSTSKGSEYATSIESKVNEALTKINSGNLSTGDMNSLVKETKASVKVEVNKARSEAKGVQKENDKYVGIVENTTSTDASDNKFGTILVETDQGSLEDAILTDKDIVTVDNGKDIQIYVKVTDVTDETTNQEVTKIQENEDVKSILSENKDTTITYLDVSMMKKEVTITYTNGVVTNKTEGEATKITDILNEEVNISMTVPEELVNNDSSVNRTYKVVRAHTSDGEVETDVLDATYSNGVITFKTDRFSTYALIYTDSPANNNNTSDSNSNSSNNTTSTSSEAVKTCEEAIGRNWTWSNKSKTCVYRVKNTNTK